MTDKTNLYPPTGVSWELTAADWNGLVDDLATEVADREAADTALQAQIAGGSLNPQFESVTLGANGVAKPIVLDDVTGTNGRRLSIQPSAADQSGEIQVIPGASCSSAIKTQIIFYNKIGSNYERLAINCVNDQYIIDSTALGTGTIRNLYITMGDREGTVTGRNAVKFESDASVILNGATFTADGQTWGYNRTTVGDFTNTGSSRLIIDTRTGTPASVTSDNTVVEYRRGGVKKWCAGLNHAGENVDRFDFDNSSDVKVFGLTQTGVSGNAYGMKHDRVSTGSISANSDALVTLTWSGTAFSSSNYTVVASVHDTTGSNSALKVVHVENIATTYVSVRVRNDSSGSLTGTLHCIAMHD